MNKHQYFICSIILLSCLTTLTSKAAEQPQNTEIIKKEIQQVFSKINVRIGEKRCDTNDQCDTIAIGHKACGGPQAYLTYSTHNTDVQQLTELTQKHRKLSQRYNKLTGMMSNCMVLNKPETICHQKVCRESTQLINNLSPTE